ncbi:MAG: hypothetical protein V3U98_01900 [Acidobacteriota bacterium]
MGARACLRCVSAGVLICLAWGLVRAEAPEDRSTSEILDRLERHPAALSGLRGARELWQSVSGPEPLPVRCGTQLALALHLREPSLHPLLRAGVQRLLSAPPGPHRVVAIEGFEWRLPSGDGLPIAGLGSRELDDALRAASEQASRALRYWSDDLGWLLPSESASGRALPIYLSGTLPPGTEGLAIPVKEPARTFEEDATAVLILSPRLVRDPEALAQVLIHQLAHAILWAYSHHEEPAWQEASAVALEIEARRDASPYIEIFGERLLARSVSLRSDRMRLAQGSGLWALFLDLSRPATGPALRLLWEELAAVSGDNLSEAADTTFATLDGSDLGQEVATYLAWGLFTGERDDGRHFPFGAALPAAEPDALHAAYPAQGSARSVTLQPWSGYLLSLHSGEGPGGLRFEFQGQDSGRWRLLALFESRDGGPLYSAEVPVDAGGGASLSFPWQSVGAATLAIAYVSAPENGPGAFSYSVWHDPTYPYELAGLRAEPVPEGVTLSWTTLGETELVGWNIYRSLPPSEGFVRVNRLSIPAGGNVREPLNYLFLDADSAAGKKYYYCLEGLTAGGFTQRSPRVSVRTLGTAPRR